MGILAVFVAGCSSRYTVSSPKYDAYSGEINQHARLIDAPPRRVFEILTDAVNLPALCPKGTVVTYLSSPPYKTGSLVETRIEHIFSLKWLSRVEAVDPYHMIRLVFQSGFFAGGTEIWELNAEDGKTRVSHTIIVHPKGFLRRAAWFLKVRRKHDRMVEQFLDNLTLLTEDTAKRTIP
jgi:uncharacterized protein YndB with AHSA1/START domain